MSTSLNPLFFICLVIAVIVGPAFASSSQDAIGVINGDGNKQVVGNEIITNVAKQYVDENVVAPTYININNEAPVNSVPDISGLDVGTVDESVLMYPMEVISYPIGENMTYYIRSATPIAVYTIATGNDRMLLESSESMLTYNPSYHRFEHGIVSPLTAFPKFTEKCSITAEAPGYVVLDNRYFPEYAMVEISPSPF
jgi:hypothetical protein